MEKSALIVDSPWCVSKVVGFVLGVGTQSVYK